MLIALVTDGAVPDGGLGMKNAAASAPARLAEQIRREENAGRRDQVRQQEGGELARTGRKLERCGAITNLQRQVKIELMGSIGRSTRAPGAR